MSICRSLAVAAATLVATGCGFGAVEVTPHSPAAGTEQACAGLVAALPEVVSDAVRRDVSPSSPSVAAWGQPPIILRCGVPEPVGVDPTTSVLQVSQVEWLPVPGDGGTFFTTVGTSPVVEVAVPDDYSPEAQVLVDLAPAIQAEVPLASADPTAG